jgi:hypothetical protein
MSVARLSPKRVAAVRKHLAKVREPNKARLALLLAIRKIADIVSINHQHECRCTFCQIWWLTIRGKT